MPRQVLEGDGLKVILDPVQEGPRAFRENQASLLDAPALRSELKNTRHRLVAFRTEDDKESEEPVTFEAEVYDYSNRRTLIARGSVKEPSRAEVTETTRQSRPGPDELAEAIEILKRDADLGAGIDSGALVPYQAMPPLLNVTLPDGSVERRINVGLYAERSEVRHRFVAVNLVTEEVTHSPAGAPLDRHLDCGVPAADPCPPGRGSGKVRVTVKRGSQELWSLVVVKPAISSGSKGSGVELRKVRYRDRKVLHKAHLPILNVEYDRPGNRGCGPTYRDWQNEEACFIAHGENVLPGYRACSQPAKTIFESGRDTGNFRGVAFYIRKGQLFLVSELAAGWYRYLSEWRLHENGMIRPRFGFNAVRNPCTCKAHHHHAYWRLEFDIEGKPCTVEEFNDPPVHGSHNWHSILRETRRRKQPSRDRKWRIRNRDGRGYEIVAGAGDGRADEFGVGDLWVVKRRSGQIDDGPGPDRARIDSFVNGERVREEELVVWYAAHFRHSPGGNGDHIVGPRLVPDNW